MSTFVFAPDWSSALRIFYERGQEPPSNAILIRSVEDTRGRVINPSVDKVEWAEHTLELEDAFFVLTCHLPVVERTQLRLGE